MECTTGTREIVGFTILFVASLVENWVSFEESSAASDTASSAAGCSGSALPTVFGLVSAANRPVANIMAAAQVPRNNCLVMVSPHRILTLEAPQNAVRTVPLSRPHQRDHFQRGQ